MIVDSQSILHMYKLEVPHSVEEANQVMSRTSFQKVNRKFDRAAVLFWWTKLFVTGLPNEVVDSWLKASKDIFLFCRPDDKVIISGSLSMALYISQNENFRKQLNQIKLWFPLVNNKTFRIYTHAERGTNWSLFIKPKYESDLLVDGPRVHKSFSRLYKAVAYLQRHLWFRHPRNARTASRPSARNTPITDSITNSFRRMRTTYAPISPGYIDIERSQFNIPISGEYRYDAPMNPIPEPILPPEEYGYEASDIPDGPADDAPF